MELYSKHHRPERPSLCPSRRNGGESADTEVKCQTGLLSLFTEHGNLSLWCKKADQKKSLLFFVRWELNQPVQRHVEES